jgi:hypothetical protein
VRQWGGETVRVRVGEPGAQVSLHALKHLDNPVS